MADLGLVPGSLTQGYTLPEIASALNIASNAQPQSLNLQPTASPSDLPTPPASSDASGPIGDSPYLSPADTTMPQMTQPVGTQAPSIDLSSVQAPAASPVSIARPAPGQEPFYDFENNPLRSIGRAMGQFAAGYQGAPQNGPLAAWQKQQFQQQEMQFKAADFALNALEKVAPLVINTPASQRAAVIADLDQRFKTPLMGQSIGPFLTAITAGSDVRAAAALQALKSLNPSPQMLAYFADNPQAAVKFLDERAAHLASQNTPEETQAQARAQEAGKQEGGQTTEQKAAEAKAIDAAKMSPAEKDALALGLIKGTPDWNAYIRERTLPKGTTVNVVNAAESSYAKALGETQAQAFTKRQDVARGAAQSIRNIEAVKPLIEKGMFTGPYANWKLQAAKLAGVAPEQVANTEAFQAAMASQTAQIIKEFGSGTGLSDADREYAMKAAGGNITANEGSLKRILDIQERAAHNALRNYNEEAARVQKSDAGKGLPDLSIEEPYPTLTPEQVKTAKSGTIFYTTDGRLGQVK